MATDIPAVQAIQATKMFLDGAVIAYRNLNLEIRPQESGQYFEELTEFFEPDREIICFRDEAELLDKVRHYLRNDAARESIRDAGLRRARAEHTWHQRFSQAFRAMGLN